MEAEAFEGLIEVFSILQSRGLSIDNDFFAFSSSLFELNHAELSDLMNDLFRKFEL